MVRSSHWLQEEMMGSFRGTASPYNHSRCSELLAGRNGRRVGSRTSFTVRTLELNEAVHDPWVASKCTIAHTSAQDRSRMVRNDSIISSSSFLPHNVQRPQSAGSGQEPELSNKRISHKYCRYSGPQQQCGQLLILYGSQTMLLRFHVGHALYHSRFFLKGLLSKSFYPITAGF